MNDSLIIACRHTININITIIYLALLTAIVISTHIITNQLEKLHKKIDKIPHN
jgi:hypothetical protein